MPAGRHRAAAGGRTSPGSVTGRQRSPLLRQPVSRIRTAERGLVLCACAAAPGRSEVRRRRPRRQGITWPAAAARHVTSHTAGRTGLSPGHGGSAATAARGERPEKRGAAPTPLGARRNSGRSRQKRLQTRRPAAARLSHRPGTPRSDHLRAGCLVTDLAPEHLLAFLVCCVLTHTHCTSMACLFICADFVFQRRILVSVLLCIE